MKNKIFLGLLGICISSFIFADDEMDSITMPQMPSISMPSVGNGFYTPSSSGFYTGRRQDKNTKKTSDSKSTSNKVITSDTQKAINDEVSKITSIDSSSNDKKVTKNTNLTASDISTLDNLGLLGSLSGFLGNNNPLVQKNAVTDSNTKALENILNELKDIKANSDSSAKPISLASEDKKESKILRFNSERIDYLKLCQTIFFSSVEADGTFLLTGDTRNETFYFLFKSIGIQDGIAKYDVSISVSQIKENAESIFRKLTDFSENNDLTATRVGNLVTLRLNDDVKLDLLLSLEQ